jgi:hypothetical protein
VSDYEKLGGLPVEIDRLELERREFAVSPEFTRVTTTIVLHGGGETGRGEDVTYYPLLHDDYPRPDLTGSRTLDELSQSLEPHGFDDYRLWAFESAALELALRQAGTSLGAAVGREYRPVRFVVSTREDIRAWLEHQPSLEFKVDPSSDWSRELIAELAATGRIRVADFKAYYVGTPVDQEPDPRLYRDVLELLPNAIIEDAGFTDETRPILSGAEGRLSFDAPIHSVADVDALEVEPGWLNIKPSRFGSVRGLLDTIEYAGSRGMKLYGGGQFELGIGRNQIQALASLYYADAHNDVAPGAYNEPPPRPGLPTSPLPPPAQPVGFGNTP